MSWPNREPHVLAPGMRKAQRTLADFLPLIDWRCFHRRNVAGLITIEGEGAEAFGCGDGRQAVLWLLRTDIISADGRLSRIAVPARIRVVVPDLGAGHYRLTCWDTERGCAVLQTDRDHPGGAFNLEAISIITDLAIAIRKTDGPKE